MELLQTALCNWLPWWTSLPEHSDLWPPALYCHSDRSTFRQAADSASGSGFGPTKSMPTACGTTSETRPIQVFFQQNTCILWQEHFRTVSDIRTFQNPLSQKHYRYAIYNLKFFGRALLHSIRVWTFQSSSFCWIMFSLKAGGDFLSNNIRICNDIPWAFLDRLLLPVDGLLLEVAYATGSSRLGWLD